MFRAKKVGALIEVYDERGYRLRAYNAVALAKEWMRMGSRFKGYYGFDWIPDAQTLEEARLQIASTLEDARQQMAN